MYQHYCIIGETVLLSTTHNIDYSLETLKNIPKARTVIAHLEILLKI